MDMKAKKGYRLVLWAIFAITILLALCGANSVKAYAGETGSITLVACTAPANANSTTILPGQTTPVSGAVFTLQKLSDRSGAANADVGLVNVDSQPLPSFAAQTLTSGSDGIVTFANLERGVYLVTQTPPAGYRAAEPKFMVAIPMADATAASGENWNVKVYPKLQSDSIIKKTVSNAPMVSGVGDLITWSIDLVIPQDIKAIDAYGAVTYSTDWIFYDDFSQYVDYLGADPASSTYQASVIEVKDAAGATLLTLSNNVDYTETYDAAARRAIWTLKEGGIKKIADAEGGAKVTVTVHSVVNENAYGIMTYVFNNAEYKFTDPFGDPHSGKVTPGDPDPNNPNDPHVAIGGLIIDKYLAGTDTRLAGAHFKVATSKENAAAGKFLSTTKNGKAVDIELVTDDKGAAKLGGLGSGNYFLVETQAPSTADSSGNSVACTLPASPYQITVGADESTRVVTASIANSAPSSPGDTGNGISQVANAITNGVKTGDPGTWAVLIAIIALAAFGCVVAARKRRDESKSAGRADR